MFVSISVLYCSFIFVLFKQKTAYDMRISDWSSDVCSSDLKNLATAWAMLRARIYEAELKRREEAAQAAASAKSDIGFGHQIRSYVLQPYQLVDRKSVV